MTDEEKKMSRAYRSNRLREFYERKGYTSKTKFADAMDVPKQNLNAYLNGDQDPVNKCEELIAMGCDIHWLITGEYASGNTQEEEDILMDLKKAGICNRRDVKRLITIHNSLKPVMQTEARAEPRYTDAELDTYLGEPERKNKRTRKADSVRNVNK